jgi:hypothetical protein
MPRRSDDPYGDFVVRVMNAARIALAQGDSMSQDEFRIVEMIRDTMLVLDPASNGVRKANVIISQSRTLKGSHA